MPYSLVSQCWLEKSCFAIVEKKSNKNMNANEDKMQQQWIAIC